MSDDRLSSGDTNITITGSDIHIHGGIHQSTEVHRRADDEFERPFGDARRTTIKKLPLTAGGGILVGAAGLLFSLLANISSIFSANPGSIPAPLMDLLHMAVMPIIGVSGLLMIVGIHLKLHSVSMGVSILGNIERGEDGSLYFSRVKAKCPICGGTMRMVGASKYHKDHTLVCRRNPDHKRVLDMTTLPDVSHEFEARRGK